VCRALAEEEQHCRLGEALDAHAHVELPRGDAAPHPRMAVMAVSPGHTCKTHMYRASIPIGTSSGLG
jgi:hypothetical protein